MARTSVDADGAGPGRSSAGTPPTGTLSAHGTAFVGFCATQEPLAEMLRRMAGLGDGVRDALTRYTRPVTGAYYTVPSVDALAWFAASPRPDPTVSRTHRRPDGRADHERGG